MARFGCSFKNIVSQQNLVKKIALICMAGIFLASIVVASQHHDDSLSLTQCSISKVKNSISGTVGKHRADGPQTLAINPLWRTAVLLPSAVVAQEDTATVISSPIVYLHYNKAPPTHS